MPAAAQLVGSCLHVCRLLCTWSKKSRSSPAPGAGSSLAPGSSLGSSLGGKLVAPVAQGAETGAGTPGPSPFHAGRCPLPLAGGKAAARPPEST
jgi:hypothetical protein